jgi:hypothetical protein
MKGGGRVRITSNKNSQKKLEADHLNTLTNINNLNLSLVYMKRTKSRYRNYKSNKGVFTASKTDSRI